MTSIQRLRITIGGGGVVGPGVMTFYAAPTAGANLVGAAKTFLTSLAPNIPNTVTFEVPGGGDTFDDVTGALGAPWTASGAGQVVGTGNTAFAVGSGFRIRWVTPGIVANRHLVGTTYVVPSIGGCFDSTGRMAPATFTSVSSTANTFLSTAGLNLGVWSKPAPARLGKHGTLPARSGKFWAATSVILPTLPTALRSRRY